MADPSNNKSGKQGQASTHNFAVDLAHDFGGAIVFSIPLLMTMEMWWLGFYMDRFRLAVFLVLGFLFVMGISFFKGGQIVESVVGLAPKEEFKKAIDKHI